MKKETEYREPIGFNGTKGEWDLGYGDSSKAYGVFTKNMLDVGLNESPVCLVSPADKLDETDKANAKLISQSKELAKALQDMTNKLHLALSYWQPESEADGNFEQEEFKAFTQCERSIAKSKQVLKEAGLNNE